MLRLASISQNGISLTLINGSSSATATVESTTQLQVTTSGNNSAATYGDGRISFSNNGQIWTKLDLPTNYTNQGGAATHVIQNGTSLTFVDKLGNTSPGSWTSPTVLFASAWNEPTGVCRQSGANLPGEYAQSDHGAGRSLSG